MRFHLGLRLMKVAAWLLKLDGKETPYVGQTIDNKRPIENLVLSRGLEHFDKEKFLVYHMVGGQRWYY